MASMAQYEYKVLTKDIKVNEVMPKQWKAAMATALTEVLNELEHSHTEPGWELMEVSEITGFLFFFYRRALR